MRRFGMTALAVLLACGVAQAQECTATQVEEKVCELEEGYRPDVFRTEDGEYVRPRCTANRVPEFKRRVRELYSQADLPVTFKNELCKLRQIFVLPNTNEYTESWGKYEDPRFPQNGSKRREPNYGDGSSYVFLVRHLTGRQVHDAADDRLVRLSEGIRKLKPSHQHGERGGRRKDPHQLALLMVLAHEIGHIKFHRPADLVQVSPCFLDAIRDPSWATTGDAPGARWRDFGSETGEHTTRNGRRPPKPSEVTDKETLKAIYTGGFANALASASAEEDFVETYTLAVLRAYSTDSLILKFSEDAADTIDVKNRPDDVILNDKLACVSQDFLRPPPSFRPNYPPPPRKFRGPPRRGGPRR
jgi:hypothetical protein